MELYQSSAESNPYGIHWHVSTDFPEVELIRYKRIMTTMAL